MRIGHGYDVHRLVEGRKLIMGGVDIPWEKGLLGHSDADVVCHVLTDALLGATGLGAFHQRGTGAAKPARSARLRPSSMPCSMRSRRSA